MLKQRRSHLAKTPTHNATTPDLPPHPAPWRRQTCDMMLGTVSQKRTVARHDRPAPSPVTILPAAADANLSDYKDRHLRERRAGAESAGGPYHPHLRRRRTTD